MSLDKKLRKIEVPVSVRYDLDGTSNVEGFVTLPPKTIEDIKQAFIDEGWVSPEQRELLHALYTKETKAHKETKRAFLELYETYRAGVDE